jgi:hypothetical protein
MRLHLKCSEQNVSPGTDERSHHQAYRTCGQLALLTTSVQDGGGRSSRLVAASLCACSATLPDP